MENKSYAVPIVVVIAIIIIASSFFFYQGPGLDNSGQTATVIQSLTPLLQPAENVKLDSLRPLDKNDNLWGEASAPVKLIIYSDLECPACAWLHEQIKQLDDYVDTGKIAIAFRHFPLDTIHPHARNLAKAAECVKQIDGNEKSWQFIDLVFAATDKSTPNLITDIVKTIGVDVEKMTTCQAKEEDKIENEYQEAITLEAQGTPFVIIAGPGELAIPIFGGREAESLKQAIDTILADEKTEGKTPIATTTEE